MVLLDKSFITTFELMGKNSAMNMEDEITLFSLKFTQNLNLIRKEFLANFF